MYEIGSSEAMDALRCEIFSANCLRHALDGIMIIIIIIIINNEHIQEER